MNQLSDTWQGRKRKLLGALIVLSTTLIQTAIAQQSGGSAGHRGGADGEIRGITRAEATATISSEVAARIAELPFKTGQSFSKGAVLISFDCARYDADLRAAVAEVKTQEIYVDTNRQLLRNRATGANDLALAQAKLEQAIATADSLRIRTRQCSIPAPYDGRIVERLVDIFEMPAPNAPLLKIVKVGAIELDLIVPSHWSNALAPGQKFKFTVDETGSVHDAVLTNVGAVVDPVSRTLRLSARLLNPGVNLIPGMSGVAKLGPGLQARNP